MISNQFLVRVGVVEGVGGGETRAEEGGDGGVGGRKSRRRLWLLVILLLPPASETRLVLLHHLYICGPLTQLFLPQLKPSSLKTILNATRSERVERSGVREVGEGVLICVGEGMRRGSGGGGIEGEEIFDGWEVVWR